MNSGKSLIVIIIIIIVLVAGWFLWRGGYLGDWGIGTAPVSTSSTEGTTATTGGAGGQTGEQTTSGKTGSIGKMTDDIYVEMIVQAAYQVQKNPATYAANMKSLFDKYGITEENVTAYGEALSKDPTRAQAVAAKYAQELQKLMK